MRLARSVPVEMVASRPNGRRRALGPAVDHVSDMARTRRIEDRVDRVRSERPRSFMRLTLLIGVTPKASGVF